MCPSSASYRWLPNLSRPSTTPAATLHGRAQNIDNLKAAVLEANHNPVLGEAYRRHYSAPYRYVGQALDAWIFAYRCATL
jgi:hypothetical protein